MSDDKQAKFTAIGPPRPHVDDPTDAAHVTSLDEITADGPVLWTSDAMVTVGPIDDESESYTKRSGTIFAIPDDGTRGSWREPRTSTEGNPRHMLWAPIAAQPTLPTDAEIVALMKLRGNGTREQPRSSEIGTPVGLAWRGVAILEADAQAAWDRFHAPPETLPTCARCGGTIGFDDDCPRCNPWEE